MSKPPTKATARASVPPASTRTARGGARASLTRQTLLKMAVRVALVIVVATVASYVHAMDTMTDQALDGLQNYVSARGEREQWIFDLASDNQEALVEQLLTRLHDDDGADPFPEIERRFARAPDGVLRSRPEIHDPKRDTAAVILDPSKLDRDVARRVLVAQDTLSQMGHAMHIRLQNTWMAMPENIFLSYWPEEPDLVHTFKAQDDLWSWGLINEVSRDPARKSVWSDIYWDRTKQGAVSLVSPIYDGDRILGVVANDIPLSELLEHTARVKLAGTYNVIVREDGNLITHPALDGAIEKAGGGFHVSRAGDAQLTGIYEAARSIRGESGVVEDASGAFYLGVMRLRGPRWYLIVVYPKAVLQVEAYGTARFVLVAGVLSLIIEIALLFWILRSQVAQPIGELLAATKLVASGKTDIELSTRRGDELGALAGSFNAMIAAVRSREERSRRAEEASQKSEERFRLLFELSADPLLLVDGEALVVVDCNAAAARAMSVDSPKDLVSTRISDLAPERQPDGSLSAESARAHAALAAQQGSHRFEWLARSKSGEELQMDVALASVHIAGEPILYAVCRDVTERVKRESQISKLNEELAAMLQREREKNDALARLRATVDVLSTPVLEVWRDVLVLPLIGAVDDRRASTMVEKLLHEVARKRCRNVILDITGVEGIDAPTASRLLGVVAAVRLLGARCLITGIGPDVARALVDLDVDFGSLVTLRTLEDGLRAWIFQRRRSHS